MAEETEFKSRVLTGVIVNKQYLDPQRFLADTHKLVLDRIHENVKRHSCVRVNAMFNGEFINKDQKIKLFLLGIVNSYRRPIYTNGTTLM